MKRLIVSLMVLLMMASTVGAEIKTYEGVGVYYMKSTSETLENSKSEAKKYAERDVLEQIEIYVASESEVRNLRLTEDELVTIAAGIMSVTNVHYKFSTSADDKFMIECRLKATVDTDKIPELVERERKARLGR